MEVPYGVEIEKGHILILHKTSNIHHHIQQKSEFRCTNLPNIFIWLLSPRLCDARLVVWLWNMGTAAIIHLVESVVWRFQYKRYLFGSFRNEFLKQNIDLFTNTRVLFLVRIWPCHLYKQAHKSHSSLTKTCIKRYGIWCVYDSCLSVATMCWRSVLRTERILQMFDQQRLTRTSD